MRPLIAFTFLSLASQVSLQVVDSGICPTKSVKSDFNLNKYLGTWYQYASFGTELFQGRGKCVSAQYSLDSVTKKVKVHNSQVNLATGLPNSIDGTALLENPKNRDGKLSVTFTFKVLGQPLSVSSPYWILDTDYDSWAIVYSCTDLRAFHFTAGWILTREQDLSNISGGKDVIAQINNALAKAKLNSSLYKKTVQNDCPRSWTNY